MKFRKGDSVTPTGLSIQNSNSSKPYIGVMGTVAYPSTAHGWVKVRFASTCTGDGQGGFYGNTEKYFVYHEHSLRLVGADDGPSLTKRIAETRKVLEELEWALASRTRWEAEIEEVFVNMMASTVRLPKPAQEEIRRRLGQAGTVPNTAPNGTHKHCLETRNRVSLGKDSNDIRYSVWSAWMPLAYGTEEAMREQLTMRLQSPYDTYSPTQINEYRVTPPTQEQRS